MNRRNRRGHMPSLAQLSESQEELRGEIKRLEKLNEELKDAIEKLRKRGISIPQGGIGASASDVGGNL